MYSLEIDREKKCWRKTEICYFFFRPSSHESRGASPPPTIKKVVNRRERSLRVIAVDLPTSTRTLSNAKQAPMNGRAKKKKYEKIEKMIRLIKKLATT